MDRFTECHIDRELSTVSVGCHSAQAQLYPMSIEWPPSPLQGQAPVAGRRAAGRRAADCRATVRARHGLSPDTLLDGARIRKRGRIETSIEAMGAAG